MINNSDHESQCFFLITTNTIINSSHPINVFSRFSLITAQSSYLREIVRACSRHFGIAWKRIEAICSMDDPSILSPPHVSFLPSHGHLSEFHGACPSFSLQVVRSLICSYLSPVTDPVLSMILWALLTKNGNDIPISVAKHSWCSSDLQSLSQTV
jgi:hypothetical protein